MPTKPRNTLPKRIRELVLHGDLDSIAQADEICAYSRVLCRMEKYIGCYRFTIALFDKMGGLEPMKSSTTKTEKSRKNVITMDDLFRALKEQEKELCQMFLDAIKRGDADKILEIAEAVMFLTKHEKLPPTDPERRWLIFLKSRLDKTGLTMTVRQVAEFLSRSMNKPFDHTEDGFSALRRKCKQLAFPLARSRKRSQK